MINVQTGNMLDVIVEGKSIGLKQRDSDHRKYEVIWLPKPEGLRDVLTAEIARLNPPERQTTNSTSEREQRQANLTEQDKTRFPERGFAVVENAGHSLRLIKRDDARQAISIQWDDLPALRELITLALDDGPMVIGLDMSGQAAKNAATSMRDLCVKMVKARRDKFQRAADSSSLPNDLTASRDAAVAAAFTRLMGELQSLTLDNQQPVKEEACCISALIESRERAAKKRK